MPLHHKGCPCRYCRPDLHTRAATAAKQAGKRAGIQIDMSDFNRVFSQVMGEREPAFVYPNCKLVGKGRTPEAQRARDAAGKI